MNRAYERGGEFPWGLDSEIIWDYLIFVSRETIKNNDFMNTVEKNNLP